MPLPPNVKSFKNGLGAPMREEEMEDADMDLEDRITSCDEEDTMDSTASSCNQNQPTSNLIEPGTLKNSNSNRRVRSST
jgi:hypothetical protein